LRGVPVAEWPFYRMSRGSRSYLHRGATDEDYESFDADVSDEPGHEGWIRITRADFPGAQPVLYVQVVLSGGRYVVSGLHVETNGVRLPVRDLARLPLAAIAAAFEDFPDSFAGEPDLGAEPARPGRRGRPDDFYRRVAAQYRAALARAPTKPVQSMANRTGRNPSTVHRWLTRARELGYLDDLRP
jgi:hypothetical protein